VEGQQWRQWLRYVRSTHTADITVSRSIIACWDRSSSDYTTG